MIKINLAQKKQAAGSGGGGGGGTAAGGGGTGTGMTSFTNLKNVKFDREMFKELPLPKLAVAIAVAYGANYFAEDYMQTQLQAQDQIIETLNSEKNKAAAEKLKTADFRELEKVLESDKNNLLKKIGVIEKLMLHRNETFTLLKTVSELTPADLWLTDLRLEGEKVSLKASVPSDSSSVTEFPRLVAGNALFTGQSDTQQGTLTNTIESSTGIRLSVFEVTTKRRAP
jgi:Tfp pilus assembly protein PilN